MTTHLKNWQNSCAVDCIFMTMLDGQPDYYRSRMVGDKVPDINAACLDAARVNLNAQALQTAMNETMDIIDGKNTQTDKCINLRNLLNKCDKFVYEKDAGSGTYVISSAVDVYENLAKMYHMEVHGIKDLLHLPTVCGIEWMSTGRRPYNLRDVNSDVLVIHNELRLHSDDNIPTDSAMHWIGPTLLDGKYELYGAVSNIRGAHFVSRYIDRRGKWVFSDDLNPRKVDIPDLDKYPALREELLKWGGKSTMYKSEETPVLWFYRKTNKNPSAFVPSTITQEELFTLLHPLTQRQDGRYRNALINFTVNNLLAPIVDIKSGLFGHIRAMFLPTPNANYMHHLQAIHGELVAIGGVTRNNFMNKVMGAFAFFANSEYKVALPSGHVVHRSQFVIDIAPEERLTEIESSAIFLSNTLINRIKAEKDVSEGMQHMNDLRLTKSWCTFTFDNETLTAKVRSGNSVIIVNNYSSRPESNVQSINRPDMGIDAKDPTVVLSGINVRNAADEKQTKMLRLVQRMTDDIANTVKRFGADPPRWSNDNDKVIVLKGNGLIDDATKTKLVALRQQIQNSGGQLIRVMLYIGRRLYIFCSNILDCDWVYVFDMTDRGNLSDTMKDYITGAIDNVASILFPDRWIEASYRISPPSLSRPVAAPEQQFGLAAIILSMVRQAASLYSIDLYLSEKMEKLTESDASTTVVSGFNNIENHVRNLSNLVTSIDLSVNPATKAPLLPTEKWWDFVPASVNVNFLVDLCKKLKPNATCDREKNAAEILQTLMQ
uniref:Uncharacterized protein n=1 Tax=Clandestinovirus TaxID=2831644 RepID=A0A8F8KP82_9VIRU|nr:hypothetical protein KOM_12_272 [Clandestinovirus]